MLSDGARKVVAVAPRLFTHFMEPGDVAPLGAKAWGDAKLNLEGAGPLVNALTGEGHEGNVLRVADLLAVFPVALLVSGTR
jgi:maltooligosyltrehalose synthase